MPEQPTLVSQSKDSRGKSQGPVFDKKHFKKQKVAIASVMAVAAVVAILISLSKINSSDEASKNDKSKTATISTTILKGDSKTLAARRVVTEYLKETVTELTAGQRLFMETNLRRTLADISLKVGESVEFKKEAIASLVIEAKALRASTLDKWEMYAKGIKF